MKVWEEEFNAAKDKVVEVEKDTKNIYKQTRARNANISSEVSTRKKRETRNNLEASPFIGPMTRARKNVMLVTPGIYVFLTLNRGLAW